MSSLETYSAVEVTDMLLEVTGLTQASVNRMVRYYTTLGLIPVAGELNVGAGRSRAYNRDGYLYAAILLSLNQLGVALKPISEIVQAIRTLERREKRTLFALCKALATPCLGVVATRNTKGALAFRAGLFELADGSHHVDNEGDMIIVRLGKHFDAIDV